ncbi:unnamed protein product [Caenorhabditis nigoni]
MTTLLKLVVIGTILVGVAHGASLATADAEKTNCELADGFKALSCAAEFKNSCDSLEKCFSMLTSCNPEAAETHVSSIRNYCSAVAYLANESGECCEKLESNRSECSKNWDGLQDAVDEKKDENKIEEMKKNTCKNCFAKDQCLKMFAAFESSYHLYQQCFDNMRRYN